MTKDERLKLQKRQTFFSMINQMQMSSENNSFKSDTSSDSQQEDEDEYEDEAEYEDDVGDSQDKKKGMAKRLLITNNFNQPHANAA